MAMINLRDFYPWYTQDEIIEVSDEVAAELLEAKRRECNYLRRVSYNKAYYSLDAGDGIENKAVYTSLSPHQVYERQLMFCRLCRALNSLPEIQGRRIEAHFILGKSKAEIAQAEGVSKSRVSESIKRGLRNMKKYLQNSF